MVSKQGSGHKQKLPQSIVQQATKSTDVTVDQSVNWREDRLKGKSDWTIHVVRSNDESRDIYYVHTKVVDNLSSRRVPFFEPIFKDKMKQIGDRTSELTLPPDVASAFDKLLDFLYCSDRRQEEEFLFNVKNGLSLYKVAEHFEVEALKAMLTKFYRDKTTPFHFAESTTRTNEKGHQSKEEAASPAEQFARDMHTLEYVDELKLDPHYLLKALKKRDEWNLTMTKHDSENISCLIALSTKHCRNKLTRAIFYKMTQEIYIPYIDQEAALQLLTVETELEYWTDTDNFSSVQARCIQALLSDWHGLRKKFDSDGDFWKTLRGLSPNVLGILLMQSTGTAQGRADSSQGRDPPPPTSLE